MITVALYARVSSEKQAQANTIASQIDALKSRIIMDGLRLLDEHQFIDNGFSGSNIVRPGLERLRDQVASGIIDKIYIHSPDRLSRKYAYQMILIEEFEKHGTEVTFLNFDKSNENPESQLLLQMQGMIAEYERSKIMERHRRGRIHAAKRGSINVLSGAPYGYRYIDKHTGQGEAYFEIIDDEAAIIKKMFSMIGRDRMTIGKVVCFLNENKIPTKKGKKGWDRSTVWYMLNNPAYKGQAAFGRKKTGARIAYIRPRRDSSEQPKHYASRYAVDHKDWICISVPAIVDEAIFDAVQEQMEENKKRARVHKKGEIYLLQGLLVCQYCGRACCGGKSIKRSAKKETVHLYYRCIGTDSARFGGTKMCTNKQVSSFAIECVVWEEVKKLLKNPQRIFEEYQRRLMELEKSPVDEAYASLEKRKIKLEKGISLLIDSYAQQYITKDEFEPRIQIMRQNLKITEEQRNKLAEQKNLTREIKIVVTSLEQFSGGIMANMDKLDWHEKREVMRRVVKRIELGEDEINVVYRINKLPEYKNDTSAQDCCNRT